jgi:predicted RNase H-like HicB family nuclease
MVYKVRLVQSEEGFAAPVLSLPGCFSEGKTEEEALANVREAIKEYLEVLAEVRFEGRIREVEVA